MNINKQSQQKEEVCFEEALYTKEAQEVHLEVENYLREAICLDELADIYYMQGRYEEAEPLLRRAFSIYEEHLGEDFSSTTNNLNSLAMLYQAQGKYEEAEKLEEGLE